MTKRFGQPNASHIAPEITRVWRRRRPPCAETVRANVYIMTLPGPPPGGRSGAPSKVAGLLADEWTEEDDRILEQIQADRKAAKWRELPE